MNRSILLGGLALTLGASFVAHEQRNAAPRYTPRAEAAAAAYAQGQFEWLDLVRGNVNTGRVEQADVDRMAKQVASFNRNQRKVADFTWTEMGPDNVGGRVRGICVDPSNSQKIWAGGVSGGLWKSMDGANTWERISSFRDNLMVSSIAITGNGHLYVATGCEHEGGFGTGSSGFIGDGLFMSADDGATFSQVLNASPNWDTGIDWTEINRIKKDPSNPNRLYIAAQDPGARIYDESDGSISAVLPGAAANQSAYDVDISNDGSTVLWSVGIGDAWRGVLDNGNYVYERLDGSGVGVGFPQSNIGRLELALAQEDANYMYAISCLSNGLSSGAMGGVWYSTDRGVNWFRMWPENPWVLDNDPNTAGNQTGPANASIAQLDIFRDNKQGFYDMAIAVRPGHPDEVWVGGVELWKTTLTGQPNQLAASDASPGCFFCVHADVHEIVFADENNAYIGCDGGVHKTPNGGFNFYATNRNLAITQFYAMAFNPQGAVMGGTQDNGTQLITGNGNTPGEARSVYGGDGFAVDMSQMDTNMMFACVYFGDIVRSNDGGNNFGSFYDSNVPVNPNATLGVGLGDFYTNFRLFENPKDMNSPWIVRKRHFFPAGDTIWPGETVGIPFRGNIGSVQQYGSFTNTGTDPIIGPFTTDTLDLNDRVTSLFAAGFSGSQGIWVTRQAESYTVGLPAEFQGTPIWARVTSTSAGAGGDVTCMEWSNDGNTLYWGTGEGDVYAVDGFANAYTRAQLWKDSTATCVLSNRRTVFSSSGVVTSIAPDPVDINRMVITLGGYGGSSKVRLCTNVTDASPDWTNIWNVPGELVGMPCYSSLINKDNTNIIAVGADFGVWITDDGGNSWTNQSNGIPGVPVFSLRQQTWNWENNPVGPDWITNPNVIYAGSHGRGIFRTENLVGIRPQPTLGMAVGSLTLFPNPATTQTVVKFELAKSGPVTLNVYDMDGKLVRTIARRNMAIGTQNVPVNVGDLLTGTYIVEVSTADGRSTGRMVVTR